MLCVGILAEGKEITTMCDILQSWIDEGVEKGIEQGRQQGIEQGRQQGIEQGRQQGIEQGVEQGELRAYRHSVAALMKGGKSLEDAMETLEIPQKERELLREEFSK
jgi:flagellar biosynthesis/type III secretory pathway protein FliH